MKKDSRYSSASLSIPQIGALPKPQPPARLSQEAKEAWIEVIADFPATHFRGSLHLLELYARQIALSRMLHGMIEKVDPSMPRWRQLVRLSGGITGTVCSIATKLRATPSAARGVQHETRLRRSWEDSDEPMAS